jgi:hypothetical protein
MVRKIIGDRGEQLTLLLQLFLKGESLEMLELCDLITSTTTPYEYRVQGKRLSMKLKHHSRDEYKHLNDTSISKSSVELIRLSKEMKSLPLSLGGQHGGGHLGGQHGGGGQHLGWQHGGGGQHGCGGHLGGQHGGGGQGGGGQQESKNKNLEQICMKKIRKTVGNGKKNYR